MVSIQMQLNQNQTSWTLFMVLPGLAPTIKSNTCHWLMMSFFMWSWNIEEGMTTVNYECMAPGQGLFCVFTSLFILWVGEESMHTTGCMAKSEDNVQEWVLSFYHVRSRNWTWVVRLGSKHSYPLSRITSPLFSVFMSVIVVRILIVLNHKTQS